jgi:hypothetical protein
MRNAIFFLFMVISYSVVVAQSERNEKSMIMNRYIDVNKIHIEKNSDLFKIDTLDNEQNLILKNNLYNREIDSLTGKAVDDVRGKIILLGEVRRDYAMTVDMKFLGTHIDMQGAGWFGFALRAQDCDNYEVVWFMPGGAEETNTVAYIPVAHGIVPWWTEAYARQEKGDVPHPRSDWFTARVEVIGDEFSVYVNDRFVFEKKLAYYLTSGRPGLFVGTATDVAFRRIKIEDMHD